jgi:hypothetical protein
MNSAAETATDAEIINLDEVRRARRAAESQMPEPLVEAISFLRRRKPLTDQEREYVAEIINFCRAYPEKLSAWERDFLDALAEWNLSLSDRQRLALDRIVDKIERFLARASP